MRDLPPRSEGAHRARQPGELLNGLPLRAQRDQEAGDLRVRHVAAHDLGEYGRCPVAKHGNRSATSKCGSADVLEALGVKIDLGPAQTARSIQECGFGFMFAPAYHPAMKHVGTTRREIGIRTLFNFVGPLTNPAGATHQIVGVFAASAAPLLADALARLGAERAAVVHGGDGADEVTLAGVTRVVEWTGREIIEYEIDPHCLGLQCRPQSAIAGGDAADNAQMVAAVLQGRRGPHRDVVLLNAALALKIAGAAPDLPSAYRLAADSIDSGAAADKLVQLRAVTAV